MASWVSLDASSLPIIEEVSTLTSLLSPVITGVSAAAGLASLAVKGLAATAEGTSDPLGGVRAQIDDLINDLVASGIFGLTITPDLFDKPTAGRGTDGFLRVIKAAMNDQGDTNRPTFAAGDSSSGILFMISGPDFGELAQLAAGFQALFGDAWTDLINFSTAAPVVIPHRKFETTGVVTGLVAGGDPGRTFVDLSQNYIPASPGFDPYKGQLIVAMGGFNTGSTTRVESFDNETKTFTLSPGFRHPLEVGNNYALSHVTQAQPPDWKSLRLADVVPPVGLAVEVLARVRDSMPAYGGGVQFDALSAVLEQKKLFFEALAAQIEDLVDVFNDLAGAPTIAMLPIPPQSGGNNGFISEAFGADNPPPIDPEDYTLGVVLYGGSGVYDTLGKIFPI